MYIRLLTDTVGNLIRMHDLISTADQGKRYTIPSHMHTHMSSSYTFKHCLVVSNDAFWKLCVKYYTTHVKPYSLTHCLQVGRPRSFHCNTLLSLQAFSKFMPPPCIIHYKVLKFSCHQYIGNTYRTESTFCLIVTVLVFDLMKDCQRRNCKYFATNE